MALTPSRRSELRSQAHKLNPLVIVGDKGLTEEVLAEIDRTLKAHELIKVRAVTDDRAAREQWMREICERLGAQPVQQIGKVLVVYRENPRPEREARAPDPAPRKRPPTRTAPPRSRTPSPRPESAPRRRRPRSSR